MRIHIVGIGGIGMSGIAMILKEKGYEVQGSDILESKIIQTLRAKGIKVFIGHNEKNVKDADILIYSSAIKPNNVELVKASKIGIPIIPRADVLADIMRFKEGIAVAGTHGKTTTSSMIATILIKAGLKPTVLIGGKLPLLNDDNALSGTGKYLVAEADESDGTFLRLTPSISVVTNVDADHLDFYGSIENVKKAFKDFANRTSFYGLSVLCGECPNVRSIIPKVYKRKCIYGFSDSFDIYARDIELFTNQSVFSVFAKGKEFGRFKLNVPGKHNVLNALAAIAVSLEIGIEPLSITKGLEEFRNAKRRLEIKGIVNGVTFVDDYAHHPTEIDATLDALRIAFPNRRIVILFQPHRFSRTKFLWNSFIKTFKGKQNVFFTDIYPASEKPIQGIDANLLADACSCTYLGNLKSACNEISKFLKPGDVFVSMGAGNITDAFDMLNGKV